MLVFLKNVLVVSISVVVVFLISLGVTYENVIAPDATPPAIVDQPLENEEGEQTIIIQEEDEIKEEPSPPTVTEIREKPLIDDFEKSLQEALDALAKIQQEQASAVPLSDLNTKTRASVVNILCTTAGAGSLNPISASGVIIDPRGIVLTNAHVGQYFLLKNYSAPNFVECTIRVGSPARSTYTAELLFLPSSWIAKNAHKIDDEKPMGSGEHDYALIQITGGVSSNISLPSSFANLSIALQAPDIGNSVLLAGYPAGFLGGITIQKDLYATSAYAEVQTLYTFNTNTIDLFSIGGSVVAQQGASGGAVVRDDGTLTGLIVTASNAPETENRDLRALSTEYIIRDFASERGIPLAEYLGRDLNFERQLFEQNTAPALTAALVNVLEQ